MFNGKNIRLRPERKEDVATISKLRNEEEVLINLSSYLPRPFSVDAGEYWYEHELKNEDNHDINFVIEKHDGTIIGMCGAGDIDWKNSSTIVWIFIGGPENRSKGYGSEALGLLVDFIFTEMNLNRTVLYVFGFNKRAVRSYEKVGFRLEGILKDELFRLGKYNDVYQMSILRSEYNSGKGGEQDVL